MPYEDSEEVHFRSPENNSILASTDNPGFMVFETVCQDNVVAYQDVSYRGSKDEICSDCLEALSEKKAPVEEYLKNE